jgi:hypothetical protein
VTTTISFAEYGRHDALGLAELVRTGQVSPPDLLDVAVARAQEVNDRINAVSQWMLEIARGTCPAVAHRTFRGCPVPRQGPQPGLRRHPDLTRQRGVAARGRDRARRCRATVVGGRSGRVRQDEHTRVRCPGQHRANGVRRHAKTRGRLDARRAAHQAGPQRPSRPASSRRPEPATEVVRSVSPRPAAASSACNRDAALCPPARATQNSCTAPPLTA